MYGVYIEGADHTESLADSYPCGSIWAIDWFPVNFAATQDWAGGNLQRRGRRDSQRRVFQLLYGGGDDL